MEKELMLLVGPIGSGKTTFSKTLENDTSIRISQDEMGRREHYNYFKKALEDEIPRIIIDRMNFNKEQRARYVNPARELGYVITIFEMDYDLKTCFDRAINRKDHPTIKPGNHTLINIILNMYKDKYEAPSEDEYDNLNQVKNED